MGVEHGVASCEVGNGACHLEDAVVCSCAHAQPFHGVFEACKSCRFWHGILLYESGVHLCVAVHSGVVLEALMLNLARRNHTAAYLATALGWHGR